MFLVADPTIIPSALNERVDQLHVAIYLMLMLSFVVLALARYNRSDFYLRLLEAWIKIKGLNSYLRQSFTNLRSGSILLLLNYTISTTIILTYKFDLKLHALTINESLILGIPLLYLIWGVLSVWFVSLICGESFFVRDLIQMKVLGAEVSGVILCLIALGWTLYPQEGMMLWFAFLTVILLDNVWRILKGLWLTNYSGISWYYIILYLCTLEILPLFVAYYVLVPQDFS